MNELLPLLNKQLMHIIANIIPEDHTPNVNNTIVYSHHTDPKMYWLHDILDEHYDRYSTPTQPLVKDLYIRIKALIDAQNRIVDESNVMVNNIVVFKEYYFDSDKDGNLPAAYHAVLYRTPMSAGADFYDVLYGAHTKFPAFAFTRRDYLKNIVKGLLENYTHALVRAGLSSSDSSTRKTSNIVLNKLKDSRIS